MVTKKNFSHQIAKIVNFKSKILQKNTKIKSSTSKLTISSNRFFEKEPILSESEKIIQIF